MKAESTVVSMEAVPPAGRAQCPEKLRRSGAKLTVGVSAPAVGGYWSEVPTTGNAVLHDGVKGVDGPRSEDGRHETEAERIDRNLLELLQELRVAGIGVQVLFGFLLALPLHQPVRGARPTRSRSSTRSTSCWPRSRIALLSAPVAHHRVLFRQHEKKSILRIANVAAIAGLVAVGLTISGAVLLVVSFVWDGAVVWLVSVPTATAIFALWFSPGAAAGARGQLLPVAELPSHRPAPCADAM